MRIFVSGAAGQLGRDCMERLSAGHTVQGMDLPELDIADPESLGRALDAVRSLIPAAAAPAAPVDLARDGRQPDNER